MRLFNKKSSEAKPRVASALFVRFSLKEQTLFAKRLSFLITAGVPVLESLHILRDQTESRGTKRVYDVLIGDIAEGKFLSTSLARYPRVFGALSINLIKVGESSGILAQNLHYLSDELKKKDALRKKVLGALVYPIFITIATLGVTALLTAYIFPKILPIFGSLNVELPITTRILMWVSDFLRHYGVLATGIFVLFVIALVVAHRKLPAVRFFFDRLFLRMPVVGGIMQNYNLANFCRTLGILLKSGLTVVESLSITADTTRNSMYRRHARRAVARVEAGEQMSKYLSAHPRAFPPIMSNMIAIGEKTGNLSDTLLYVSDLYEHEVEDLTKNLSSVIEPALMVVMGILVGFVAISVITPIYEITKTLQR